MRNTTKYGIIGAGKVGISIAELLLDQGKLSFIYSRNEESIPDRYQPFAVRRVADIPECSFIYIAISDKYISELAKVLRAEYPYAGSAVFAHSSGVKSANELASLSEVAKGIASVHPFQTFAYADKANLADIAWGIETEESIFESCSEFVLALEGNPLRLKLGDLQQKALYHCSAVMSSNNMTTLLQTGRLIAEKAGIPAKEFIAPIAKKTLENNIDAYSTKTIPLTGPIARADAEAIRSHIDALKEVSIVRIYCYTALATLELSFQEKIISADQYESIKHILQDALSDKS